MSKYKSKFSEEYLPVVILSDNIPLPSPTSSFIVTDANCIASVKDAFESGNPVFLVGRRDTTMESDETNAESVLYKAGCVATVKQFIMTPDGNVQLIAKISKRAFVKNYAKSDERLFASLMVKEVLMEQPDLKSKALINETLALIDEMREFLPNISNETMLTLNSVADPSFFADLVASVFISENSKKQKILEEIQPVGRLSMLYAFLNEEMRMMKYEFEIHTRTLEKLSDERKNYFLRRQMDAIRTELGDDEKSEFEENEKRIRTAKLPKEAEEKLRKENVKLAKLADAGADAALIRAYIDACLELPWNKLSKECADVEKARKILDADHEGLSKVKERILEFIAVKQLSNRLKSPIICLVGPPGTGKTSVAESIARAMKRKYVRVALGGIRDEADIRGHRRTYVGSMPGRIITALQQAGVRNPLMLLDEIDKLSSDFKGDPASALLEALDPEQNKSFRDHYIEIPFDLSDCMFITTANTTDNIPAPLLDRMEIIELHTYTPSEKQRIAKNHLIGKQMKRHGLNRRMLKISDDAVDEIISFYTREAGVRDLERNIASLCRKAAKEIVEKKVSSVKITKDNLRDYLGNRKYLAEYISPEDEVGVVNGLAYTDAGGALLKIEVAVLRGTGKIELTGSLGEVMKESAKIAVSVVREISDNYDIDHEFHKTKDIHINAPEGAIPKDGPSAGVTMTTALVSALTGIPVKRDVAMTGEITLLGKVLPIGGLKEKTLAAYISGIKTVFIPKDNLPDLDEIEPYVKEGLKFVPVSNIREILDGALVSGAEGPKVPKGRVDEEKTRSGSCLIMREGEQR